MHWFQLFWFSLTNLHVLTKNWSTSYGCGYSDSHLEKKVEQLASEFIINPSVNLNVLNHRLFVLGEVNQPGTVKITNTTMNIFEAISSSGGLRNTSNKNEVLIIRGQLENPELIKIDLTSFESLAQNDITLQPYDILYVNPNKAKNFNITVNELFPFIQLIESITGSAVNTQTLSRGK